MDEAIETAKSNPEFAYLQNARIEVRPKKMKEESSGFFIRSEGTIPRLKSLK